MNGEIDRARKRRRKYQFVNSSSLLHGNIDNSTDEKSSHKITVSKGSNSYTDDNVFASNSANENNKPGVEESKNDLKHATARKVITKRLEEIDRRGRRHTVGGMTKVNMEDIEKWIDENSQKSGKNVSKDDGEIYLASTNIVKTKMAENRRNYVIRNNGEVVKKDDTPEWRRDIRKERNSCSAVSSNREFGLGTSSNDSTELRLSNLLSLGINNRTNCFLSPRPFNKSSLQHYPVPWNRRTQKMEKLKEEKHQGLKYDLRSGEISPLLDDGEDKEIFNHQSSEILDSKYSTFEDLSKLRFSASPLNPPQTESREIDDVQQQRLFLGKTRSLEIDSSVLTIESSAESNEFAKNIDIHSNEMESRPGTIERRITESQIRPATLKTCYISPPVTVKTPTLTPDHKNVFQFEKECFESGVSLNGVIGDIEVDVKDANPTLLQAINAPKENNSFDPDIQSTQSLNTNLNPPSPSTLKAQANGLDHAIKNIQKIADNLATKICDEISVISPTSETIISANAEVSNSDSGIETEEISDPNNEFKASSSLDQSVEDVNNVSDISFESSTTLEENSTSNNNLKFLPTDTDINGPVKFSKSFNDNTIEAVDNIYNADEEINIQVSSQSDKFIKTNLVKSDLHLHNSKEKNIIKSGLKRLYQIAISTLESGCPKMMIKDVLNLFESKGIRFSDPRLKETFQRIEVEPKGPETPLDIDVFSRICEPSFKFVRSILLSQLTIPGFSIFKLRMSRIFERIKENLNRETDDSSTKPSIDLFSNYNEMMKRKNSDKTGISLSICTVDGQRISFGESESPFPLNSCASVFNLYLACTLNGVTSISSYLGKKPKPPKESEFNFNENNKVWNPFTKAGTFLSICLLFRELAVENRLEKIHEFYSKLIGQESLCCDNLSYNYKRIYGHEEIALAYYLSARQRLPRGSAVDVTDLLDLMFQSTSTAMTTDACAVGAATLANDGVCPLTGCVVASKEATRHTLNIMRSSEPITSLFNKEKMQGIALTWSENGSLMLVVPGVLGMSCFTHCQSAAVLESSAIDLIEDLTKDFNFGVYRSLRVRRDGLFPK